MFQNLIPLKQINLAQLSGYITGIGNQSYLPFNSGTYLYDVLASGFAEAVLITGDQNIDGLKTFLQNLIIYPTTDNTNLTIGNAINIQSVQNNLSDQGAFLRNTLYNDDWRFLLDGNASAIRLVNSNSFNPNYPEIVFTISSTGISGDLIPDWDSSAVKMGIFNDGKVAIGTTDYPADSFVYITGNLYSNTVPTQSGHVINRGYLESGRRLYNKINLNFFQDFSATGFNLQETFVEDSFIFTGYKINCWQSGRGPSTLNSGISGVPIYTPMTGRFYQRGTGINKTYFANFIFNSGILFTGVGGFNSMISGNNNVGLDITTGLSGVQGLNFSLLGYLNYE